MTRRKALVLLFINGLFLGFSIIVADPKPPGGSELFLTLLAAEVVGVFIFWKTRPEKPVPQSGDDSKAAPHDLSTPGGNVDNCGAGVLVVPSNTAENQILLQVAKWPETHPDDASVAVTTWDAQGNVFVRLYELNGSLAVIWSGVVGRINLSDLSSRSHESVYFAKQVESAAQAIVEQAFAAGSAGA